jgi:signal transduction histidine kinase
MRYKQQIVLIVSIIILPIVLSAQKYDDSKRDSLIKLFKNSISINHDSVLYKTAIDIYDFSSDIYIRLKYAEIAFKLADKIGEDKYRGASKLRIGITYKKLGDLGKAAKEIHQALTYYENIDYTAGKLQAYSKLAIILIAQNEYNEALEYMERVSSEYLQMGAFIRYATNILNIGELYRLNKNYKEAKKYSLEALNIFKEKEHQTGVGYALGNIGLIYLAQDSLQKAIVNLNQSIAILEPLGDNYSTSVYYEGLAQVYQKQKNYPKALVPANKSLQLAQTDGLIEQIRDANLRLSEIYSDTKQFEQAHQFYKEYIVFRDSLVNEKNIREIANMRRQYEVAQKQAEVDELNRQQEYMFNLQIFQAAVVILLLIVVFVLAKYYRRKKADNKKLEQQQTELKKLNATKDKFFSIISHDLRSPVSSFHSFLDIIDDFLKLGNIENLKRLSKELKRSTKYILELMDNLLSWSLSQKGELPFSPQPCNVNQAVEKVHGLLGKSAELKKIKLSFDLDEKLHVFADEHMFQSILRNLTSNALKFTPEGGEITISASRNNGNVSIVVADTGVGMTEDKIGHLFNLNGNKSTYGTKNEKGMGLGLRLVAEFIEINKGKINVESEVGKGTRMVVKLPTHNHSSENKSLINKKELLSKV